MPRFLRLIVLFAVIVAACAVVLAQDTPAPAVGGKAPKTKNSQPAKPPAPAEFSEEVAKQVLDDIQDGLQSHSVRRMLAAFDRDAMPNYLSFEDRLRSSFSQYDSFRSFFRILQTSTEDGRGMAIAEWRVEATPASGGPPVRREGKVRFELAAGKNGWQVVDLSPRDFFF